jgi:hypothetical protein
LRMMGIFAEGRDYWDRVYHEDVVGCVQFLLVGLARRWWLWTAYQMEAGVFKDQGSFTRQLLARYACDYM